MAEPYRVQVYNSNIARMFVPGGDVSSEASSITRRILPLARILAPKRTGNLARRHRRRVINSGIYGTRGYVESTASYAVYVHRGTTGPIFPRRSSYLVLRPAANGYGVSRQPFVKGQRAQPWLLQAANRVLLRYGVQARDTGDVTPI